MKKTISSNGLLECLHKAVEDIIKKVATYKESVLINYRGLDETLFLGSIHEEFSQERRENILVIETEFKSSNERNNGISYLLHNLELFQNIPVYVRIKDNLYSIYNAGYDLLMNDTFTRYEKLSVYLDIRSSYTRPPEVLNAGPATLLVKYETWYDFYRCYRYYLCDDFTSANKLLKELAREEYKDYEVSDNDNKVCIDWDKSGCIISIHRLYDLKLAEPESSNLI